MALRFKLEAACNAPYDLATPAVGNGSWKCLMQSIERMAAEEFGAAAPARPPLRQLHASCQKLQVWDLLSQR
ncbi:MAG: hypothetical protein EOO65_03655 [Methanosarcinales archaeon]|nr:MAG: hypothetical protein EOO65_03655 [Methanosarcinales archaeon]